MVWRRSWDDAPTAMVNVPPSSCHPWVRVDQYDRSRPVSTNDTVVDWPGVRSTFANAFSSRTGRATWASGSPT